MVTTTDQREIENFSALSRHWWDPNGPMAPLHSFTPVRIEYILSHVERFWPRDSRPKANKSSPLKGLKILDIGCGGGLLTEPMARLGGDMTGIDATETAISAAEIHSKESGLNINYLCCNAETLAKQSDKYKVIVASEVIEHVANRPLFIEAIAKILHPKGLVVITTINRSIPALVFAKFFLEYVARFIPAGTHDPKKFVRPDELREEFAQQGIILDDMTGLAPQLGGGFKQVGSLAVNYASSGGFK